MSTAKEPWFVAERSEAIAGLLLTSREDVSVRHEKRGDRGVDFVIDVDGNGPLPSQPFVVQVKGTTSSDPKDWMLGVKQLFSGSNGASYYPACVFVINVKDDTAFYAWSAEPFREKNGNKLEFHEEGDFLPLDKAAVGHIIDRVRDFYRAMPKKPVSA